MRVVKRNGKLEPFDVKKIADALYRVYREVGDRKLKKVCKEEAKEIVDKYIGQDNIPIESIQDDVENYLMETKQFAAAKAYIKYREKQKIERENPWSDNDERQDMILEKYLIKGETKKQFLKRVSINNTSLEKIFRNREGIWGGRNLYAIGRDGNITGSNCYVANDPEDSLKDIHRADYDIAQTYAFGGGQGLNLSKLRPMNAIVNNSGTISPGPMAAADRYSYTTLGTKQEKRRGALMLVMNITHPDIIDFITSKLDLDRIAGANISIAIPDKFMEAYIADKDWAMRFETPHEIIKKTMKAKDLMELINYAAHTMGDPGVIFIDTMNNYHLLSEYDEVVFTATNPCGEQPLMPDGSCNLGSINLNAFVRNPFTDKAYFDFDRFEKVITSMTWGLDDLLTLQGNRHALPAQVEHVANWREIGLGIMGLADLALSMKSGYGSAKFNEDLDEIMSFLANKAAQASALRAKELGVFPKYDYDKIAASEFFQKVYTDETKEMIKLYGLRNSRLLSIAPTGSISNILGVSGGVEPFFLLAYWRLIKSMYETERNIEVIEKTPAKLLKAMGLESTKDLPEWAKVTSQNIDFRDRAEVQSIIQTYVDTAISSTFNIPNSATTDDVKDIYVTGWQLGFKGATVFRDNCKKIGILTGGGDTFDKNPAPKPSFEIQEEWYNKYTKETKTYVTFISIDDADYTSEKIEREMCPLCGEHLVKRGGCTKCSDPECLFEKCSI